MCASFQKMLNFRRSIPLIKFHGDEVTDFHDNEIPKVDYNHTCLAVISLDSAP